MMSAMASNASQRGSTSVRDGEDSLAKIARLESENERVRALKPQFVFCSLPQ